MIVSDQGLVFFNTAILFWNETSFKLLNLMAAFSLPRIRNSYPGATISERNVYPR